MTERTLILIKPDGVQRLLVGRIIERYEARGLRIVGLKLVRVDRALAERHYAVHREKPFFAGLVEFIISAPLVAMAVEGPNAISGLPRHQRRDASTRGRAGHHPRRLRARDEPQPRPCLRLARDCRSASWRCGSSPAKLLDYARDVDRWVLDAECA